MPKWLIAYNMLLKESEYADKIFLQSRLRGRGYFIFEAGQLEEDEAVHHGGEDHHDADQDQLEAGHRPHLDNTDI